MLITVHTDGSCDNSTGIGSYGYVITAKYRIKSHKGKHSIELGVEKFERIYLFGLIPFKRKFLDWVSIDENGKEMGRSILSTQTPCPVFDELEDAKKMISDFSSKPEYHYMTSK